MTRAQLPKRKNARRTVGSERARRPQGSGIYQYAGQRCKVALGIVTSLEPGSVDRLKRLPPRFRDQAAQLLREQEASR